MQQQHFHGYEQEQFGPSQRTIEKTIDQTAYIPQPESDLQQYERNNSYQQGYNPPLPPPQFSQPMPPYQQQYMPPLAYSSHFHHNEASSDGKIASAICYLGLWLTGLLMLLFVRENRFIRFHAIQSLLFFGGINVFYFVFFFIMRFDGPRFIDFPFILLFVLVNIIGCVGWFVGIIGAFSGKFVKLPFVGDLAERYTASQPTVK